jgi:primosomal protein N''
MIPLLGAVQGLAGIAGGIIGGGARRREQGAAKAEFARNKQRMEGADTSNLYKNVENVYEDLTVNTQEADFISQQQNQGMANTMDALSGAAGGSGIAALAQSLANQQTQNAQGAAASIGRQEASNQMAERGMANQLQQQEIRGEYQARADEKEKVDTMLGMSQQRLGAANEARAAATRSLIGGVAGVAGAVVPAIPSLAAQQGEGSFMGNMMG